MTLRLNGCVGVGLSQLSSGRRKFLYGVFLLYRRRPGILYQPEVKAMLRRLDRSKIFLPCLLYAALLLSACTRITTPIEDASLGTLAAGAVTLEVEKLPIADVSGASTAVANDPTCSGRQCAFLGASKRGPYVTYRAVVPSAGRYTVQVRAKKWNARGTFQLATSERAAGGFTNVGGRTDLYTPSAKFETLRLGDVRFAAAGAKFFRFTVTGKNARSEGYVLALDTLVLVPAGSVAPATPNPDPSGGDWVALFNGQNLDGWTTFLPSKGRNNDPQEIFKVDNGMLHILDIPERGARQEFGYVATNRSYGDYHLRFEYRWGDKRFAPRDNAKRDSGVVYHIGGGDRIWPRGPELQVQEGDTGDFWLLGGVTMDTTVASTGENPKRYREGGTPYTTRPGSYVRVVKDRTRDTRNGWNTVELIVRGDDAVHIVNGEVVNRGENLRSGSDPLSEGRIAFQAEGAEVVYRNIELKPLLSESGGGGDNRRVILFNGRGTDAWTPANRGGARWSVKNGALEVRPGSRVGANDLQTKRTFGDFKLHVEFQVPKSSSSTPEQGRGNSGIYLQGRYEVQVLDSYRRSLGGKNDAGAIYGVRDASRNASRPAGSWQSYDITFRAATYSGQRKTSPARVSVVWNGVKVHDNTAISRSTTLGDAEGPSDGPIRLQDHGKRVRYRNIWIEPLD